MHVFLVCDILLHSEFVSCINFNLLGLFETSFSFAEKLTTEDAFGP